MTYKKSINHSMVSASQIPLSIQNAIPDAIPGDRTYFAGIKKPDTASSVSPENARGNTIALDILDFIQDNPLLALGGAVLTGGGLYLLGGNKSAKIPKVVNPAKHYTDAITYSFGGLAALIASNGVSKRLSQESVEGMTLRYELKKLQNAKKKHTPQKSIKKIEPRLNNHISSDICDIDMSKFFQH